MPSTARKNLHLPRAVGQVVVLHTAESRFDTTAQVKKLAFWSKLNPSEQDQLLRETDHFLAAQQQFGLTAIEVGQRLLNVQRLLTPHGAFNEFRSAFFRKSERTAYRYIDDYKRLLELFRQPVIEAMIRVGFVLDKATRERPLGQYTAAYLKLLSNQVLPPDGASEPEALRWVRQLQIEHERLAINPAELAIVQARAETQGLPSPTKTYHDLLRQDYLNFQASLRKLPAKRVDEYIESFVGYVLAYRGVSGKRFAAQAIPATFKRPSGRPLTTMR